MRDRSFAAEFDKEHGGTYVIHKGWIYYPDGARRETAATGLCLDPPDNKLECAKAITVYHKLVLDKALDAFYEQKEHYKSFTESCLRDGYPLPFDEGEAVEKLTKMRRDIAKLRQNFAAAKQAAEDLTPKQLTTSQRMAAENRRDAAKAADAIKRIRA